MARRKNNLVLGAAFTLLLLMLLITGAIGVGQINVLSNRVYDLSKRQIPLQKNIFNMKNSAQLYSGTVRNYVAWKIGKFLGAAHFVAEDDKIVEVSKRLMQSISTYPELAKSKSTQDDYEQLLKLFARMQDSKNRIVQLVDLSVRSSKEKENSAKISALLANFDNQAIQFSEFIEKRIEPEIFQALEQQLAQSQTERYQRISMLIIAVAFVFVLGFLLAIFVMRRLIKAQKHSELLVNHMVCAEERERRNLSFQMHNQMGQDLSALKIYLGIIQNKYANSDELDSAKRIVERLIERMHNIAELLCPPGLEDFGLITMLDNMVEHFRSITDADIKTEFCLDENRLAPEGALTLYRVVQESLTNIVKHAEATCVDISLKADDKQLVLSINDDGKGFEFESVDRVIIKEYSKQGHLGLLLLQERLSILNARMLINTAPDMGTKITVKMPL